MTSRPGLVLHGAAGRRLIGDLLGERCAPIVRGWFDGGEAPRAAAAGPGAAADADGSARARLRAATALSLAHTLVDVLEAVPDRAALWSTTVVHDGHHAVELSGRSDPDGPLLVSGPHTTDDLLDRLAVRICPLEAPPVDAAALAIDGQVLATLRLLFRSRRLAHDDDVTAVLADLEADDLPTARELAERLAETGLVDDLGDAVRLRPRPELNAVGSGHHVLLGRGALPAGPGPPYDVVTVELVGPPDNRFLLFPLSDGLVALLPATADRARSVLAHLVDRRNEPTWYASPVDAAADSEIPPTAAPITTTSLAASATPLTSSLVDAPAAVVLRRAGWPRGWADGVALRPTSAIGWTWRDGTGHATVQRPDAAARLLTDAVSEQLADRAPGAIVLKATSAADGARHAATLGLGLVDDAWATVARDDEPVVLPQPLDLPGEIRDLLRRAAIAADPHPDGPDILR
ncbi:hypothetical protein AB0L40_20700 [Patulibacter sp. NPDC049589]|uniref:hypothetical protein n=1 Tax=Patulibacter sp. NPDC049589 TaxID=3154731 RepID=UPI003417E0FC